MKKAVKVVGCVATGLAVAGVGYFVGKYLKPECLEDDFFNDDDEMDVDLDDDLKEVDSDETEEAASEDDSDFREETTDDCSSEN